MLTEFIVGRVIGDVLDAFNSSVKMTATFSMVMNYSLPV